MNRTATLAALFGAATWLAGCNTIRGIGEDLQAAGDAVVGVTGSKKEASRTVSVTPTPAPGPVPVTVNTPAPAPSAMPAPAPQQATRR